MSSKNTNCITIDKTLVYDDNLQAQLRYIYLIAIVIWLTIIFYFNFVEADFFIILILLIPLVVYVLSLYNLSTITVETEEKLFVFSYLSAGMIIVVPLITWTHDKFDNQHKVMEAMALAVILAVLSLIDIWVPLKYVSLAKHIRSIFQTAALTLIIYVLYYMFLKKGIRKVKRVQVLDDR